MTQKKTLVYAPRVEAFISTNNGQIIDISKDITSGSVNRRVDAVSTASITLNNRDNRYTGKLSRMDRIHIRLFKGSKQPIPVFTGYLTQVPHYDLYPSTCVIECQDTLKTIMHTFWDPTDEKAINRFIVKRQPLQQTKIVIEQPSFGSGITPSEQGSAVFVGTAEQKRVIDYAMARLGKYQYTNDRRRTDPERTGATDCSGFTNLVYKAVLGIDIGARSVDQAKTGQHVFSGTQADLANIESKLQPGDIIVYDWANWGRPTYDHVAMYVGNGNRIDHGSGQGPKLFPVNKVYQPMTKFTVRRYMQSNMPPLAGSGNYAPPLPGMPGYVSPDQQQTDSDFDNRKEEFKQQAADGLAGIRLKGFLNEVCGWDYGNILIETVPKKLIDIIESLNIEEGASNPEVAIQRVYRMIMGDTFANSASESNEVSQASSFTGSEGRGDGLITKTMYGIAKEISGIQYNASSDDIKHLGSRGGSGAYGLKLNANTRSKDSQDALMYNTLSTLKKMGNDTVRKLAAAYVGDSNFSSRLPVAGITSNPSVNEFTKSVERHSKNAPSPSRGTVGTSASGSASGSSGSTSSSVNANQVDLYLRGLREAESSNNYSAISTISSASGAYQYIDSTWNNYANYSRAYKAPPAIQDRKAREDAIKSFNKYGDWEKVAANHLYPAWANDKSKWDRSPAPGNPSVRTYVNKVTKYLGGSTWGDMVDQIIDVTGQPSGVTSETFDQAFMAYFKWTNFGSTVPDIASMMLSGEKALMNDVSAMDFAKKLCNGSMRSFQSDPYGNFVAFYPDYFGLYKHSSKDDLVKIQDVELIDFSVKLSDDVFTHVYVVDSASYPDLYNFNSGLGSKYLANNTNGVVTFENPALISELTGMSRTEIHDFLQSFGGRPYTLNAPEVTNKTFSKVLAINAFLERWAGQFNTSVKFTFMPELWPGTRALIADTGVAVYVDSVSHNFSYSSGFTTSAVISCPQPVGASSILRNTSSIVRRTRENNYIPPEQHLDANASIL